jgi:hypothetical protein
MRMTRPPLAGLVFAGLLAVSGGESAASGFVAQYSAYWAGLTAGATIAERGPRDTSHEPPLAEKFRRDIVDPLSAIEGIRDAVRRAHAATGASFTIPVYDGKRRFDVLGRIGAHDARQHLLRVELTLRPIAGFKGRTRSDEDPDDAPRPVALALTDDARLVPVSMTVPIWFLPLYVRLDWVCDATAATTTDAANAPRNCRR